MFKSRLGVFLLAIATSGPALACGPAIEVAFTESAPTDLFRAANKSADQWSVTRLELSLEGSAGDLIFDTARGGEGIQAYADFTVGAGTANLKGVAAPSDGGRRLDLEFSQFSPGAYFDFAIDLDDRLTTSPYGQTRIAGGELAGARVAARFIGSNGATRELAGAFGANNVALLIGEDCLS